MSRRQIYVASSWRNPHQPHVVAVLRAVGHEVYDFRNPAEGETGFGWDEISPNWGKWTPGEYRKALTHPAAVRGYKRDLDALAGADTTVLVLPCGRSAHLELGFAAAMRQETFVVCDRVLDQPELMYKLATGICLDVDELIPLLANPVKSRT